MIQTPSLFNTPVLTNPPVTLYPDLLHEILPDTVRYTPTSKYKVLRGINFTANSKRSAVVSRSRPLPCQLSAAARPVIRIGNSAQLNYSALIWLFVIGLVWLTGSLIYLTRHLLNWFGSPVPDLIQLNSSDLIWPLVSNSIRLFVSTLIRPIVSYSIHLTVFDWIRLSFFSIRLTFNVFVFGSSQIISVPSSSGFRQSHIGQGVFKIIQYWNRGIFHNCENSN